MLDYKTDQVKSRKELAEKYHAQLEYYEQALSMMTGKKVKETLIYSFTLGEVIEVQYEGGKQYEADLYV